MSAADGPRPEYEARRALRAADVRRLSWRDARLADARLATFALGAILAWPALWSGRISPGWLALPAALFVGLLIGHDAVARRLRGAARAVAFYDRGLARLDGTWPGSGSQGDRYRDDDHPYAADLDLFGAGSLFEWLCTARTRSGEDTLAAWLKAPADVAEIRARQAAVAELRPRLDLGEDLAAIGEDVRASIDPEALVRWGTSPPLLASTASRWAARILGTAGLIALIGWISSYLDLRPFLVVAVAEIAFFLVVSRRVGRVVASVERAGPELAVLAGLLDRIEREPAGAPLLRSLEAALEVEGRPASERIAALGRLVRRLEMRRNAAFAPIAMAALWTTRTAYAVEAWRAGSGPRIAAWLEAVGRFEALLALASASFENPGDPFPELLAETGPGKVSAAFAAEGLGHPLLSASICVRNDVALGGPAPSLLLVSGSNMSGKSTLLRAVGANAVLAQAGGVARADGLRMTRLMPGATLRVQDSLQAGRSRFYAEVGRLKRLADLASAADPPLLFLLDELLAGTNSHDRRIGAEAVLRTLIDRGAIGLATTHDLALAEIAEDPARRAANVHFEDTLDDGRLRFDYRMRPGVVAQSNALAVMRSVGLDV